jgi:hypothetical protein
MGASDAYADDQIDDAHRDWMRRTPVDLCSPTTYTCATERPRPT